MMAQAAGEAGRMPRPGDEGKRREAEEIGRDYPGMEISLPFGGLFFRADFRDPPLGVTMQHYDGDTAEELRGKLDRAGVPRRTAP